MNLENVVSELCHLEVGKQSLTQQIRQMTEIANAAKLAENALQALAFSQTETADTAIKNLLAAELALRNHKDFSQTLSIQNSILNSVIQRRHTLESKLYEDAQKRRTERAYAQGAFAGQKQKSTKTAPPKSDFEESSFETIDDDAQTTSWQAKAKLREEKKKRREQREELIREMQERIRQAQNFEEQPKTQQDDALDASQLYESIKRNARFIPKRSFSWACLFVGVTEQASLDEGKSSYRERAKLWHPDRGSAAEKELFSEAMSSLNEAWNIFKKNR